MFFGMFPQEPTSLEAVVAQAASDLRASRFCQRIRAPLRRHLATDKTEIPDHTYRSVPGPDLVRQLNTLLLAILTGAVENPQSTHPRGVDRELFKVLQSSLQIARQMVAYIWVGPLSDVAPAFVDRDNLPPPFCPMYPNARDLVESGETTLAHQLAKIVNRVKEEIEKTPAWAYAVQCASELELEDVLTLRTMRDQFRDQVSGRQSEPLRQWRGRVHGLLAAARSDVPKALLGMNRLVTASVAAMVSLAIWDHLIEEEDILEWVPRSFGDDFPNGFDVRLRHFNELVILALDSSFRLQNRGIFTGIGITTGTELSWNRDQVENIRLSVIRLSAFESPNEIQASS